MTNKLPPTETGACGTSTGYDRHAKKGEYKCQPCRDAEAQRKRKYSKYATPKPTAADIAEEIQFFLHCGEGTHAILKAIGYTHSPKNLRARLKKHGYDHLNNALFGEAA